MGETSTAGERPPRAYRAILRVLRVLVRTFFRRVTVMGIEHVPARGGGIVVSWHPNGLIDPGLILTCFPRQVVFGARHGLFKVPGLGSLLRAIGTVPIYRGHDLPGMDRAQRAEANRRSLDLLAEEIAGGSFSALFPEGVSHDEPRLLELKTGAARLFYRARALQPPDQPPAIILPVGLHYDDKDLFRSKALVHIHPPIELAGELLPVPDEPEEQAKERAQRLTDEIERVLEEVVLATDTWPLHQLMHRARKLVRAERAHRAGADPGRSGIKEKVLGFARIRAGYNALIAQDPARVKALVERVEAYDDDLSALGLEDHEIDRDPRLSSPWLAVLLVLQGLTWFLLLPPLIVVGYAVNVPSGLLLVGISKAFGKLRKDEATVKVLLGALLFPVTWVIAGVLAWWGHARLLVRYPSLPDTPLLAGVLVAVMGGIGGVLAVRYWRVAKETVRALTVRLTRRRRRRAIARLRTERRRLTDELVGFAEGVELPGSVAADGRIVETHP